MDVNELIELCGTDEISPGEMRRFEPEGLEPLAVYNVGGTHYVTSDVCTHGEASLATDGTLQGHTVECGWHFGAFDVRTGAVAASPCEVAIRSYPAVIAAGKICIRRSSS
jgi:p-cumate 2,3-dioxygenase ferredoxin component